MALINTPPQESVDMAGTQIRPGWVTFFSNSFTILSALTLSGVSASRPTKLLWIGRPYFDETVGRPIWYNGTIWIFSDGTPA